QPRRHRGLSRRRARGGVGSMPPLELENVTARYGPVQALHGVSLTVDEGQIAAVLGANGAGKTTTLRTISGTVRRDGELRFAGKPLANVGPDGSARLGDAARPREAR